MRTYTTEEVGVLYNQYRTSQDCAWWENDRDSLGGSLPGKSFTQWLHDKELSEQPAKDDVVWVSDYDDSDAMWLPRKFAQPGENNGCFCYPPDEDSTNFSRVVYWQHYSKTEPQ